MVNVSSPGDFNSCSELNGVDFAVPIIDSLERKAAIAKQYVQTFDNCHPAIL